MKINGVLNNLYISKTYECKSHIGTRNCAEINQNDRVTFTSLKLKNGENDYSDTCFYRDLKTLSSAAIILRETFPQGTEIMDFACSNGEEAISLYSFLNDQTHNNYKIHCYDKSERAIELGRKGVYTIFKPKSFDHFLLPDYKEKNTPGEVKKLLKNIKYHFYKIMKITPEPDYEINDPEFTEFLKESPDFKIKYYELRKQFKDKFKFNVGDIKDIDKIEPEKQVGAILFRNAMYIETGNLAVNQFSLNEDLNINKKEIIWKILT